MLTIWFYITAFKHSSVFDVSNAIFGSNCLFMKFGNTFKATVCPRSSEPFYILTYYPKWGNYFLDRRYYFKCYKQKWLITSFHAPTMSICTFLSVSLSFSRTHLSIRFPSVKQLTYMSMVSLSEGFIIWNVQS